MQVGHFDAGGIPILHHGPSHIGVGQPGGTKLQQDKIFLRNIHVDIFTFKLKSKAQKHSITTKAKIKCMQEFYKDCF